MALGHVPLLVILLEDDEMAPTRDSSHASALRRLLAVPFKDGWPKDERGDQYQPPCEEETVGRDILVKDPDQNQKPQRAKNRARVQHVTFPRRRRRWRSAGAASLPPFPLPDLLHGLSLFVLTHPPHPSLSLSLSLSPSLRLRANFHPASPLSFPPPRISFKPGRPALAAEELRPPSPCKETQSELQHRAAASKRRGVRGAPIQKGDYTNNLQHQTSEVIGRKFKFT
ncbi:hypothetical protein Taro_035988 [Colocasia esculenta]|uniref:Uncharacterized protein n=1 Tax=Colocasia esculenta TaxID=4460 RepID=A0A843W8B8_COLES|nr:hypothetical protein [Colocasia esculenta]